ncbi:MAG TPA: hypothetical protein ENJ09_03765 [Planctomycetes bacterium]|nr:hypothetical protein [Planctomycetota bacterium]
MKEASDAARRGDAEAAADAARRAEAALQEASRSLDANLEEAAAGQAEASGELARTQAELNERTRALEEAVREGSLSEEARDEVRAAMKRAGEAMERAQASLESGRSASAASEEREAVGALRDASEAAREGVIPSTDEGRERAEELARRQEELRQELLDLARRIEERENAKPMPALDRADQAAEDAARSLGEGDLSQAEKQEDEVQAELRQVKKELGEEEERYQRLRAEEQLFRIAEEGRALLEEHLAQIEAVAEIDAQRSAGSPPSRAQRLRLRRVARSESGLAERARGMSEAVAEEGSLATGLLLRNIADDLDRVAEDLGEKGDYQTGDRTQSLQRSIAASIQRLLDVLKQEQARRAKESKNQPQQKQDQQQGEQPLVPDAAELKLLRSMEQDLQVSVAELLRDPEALAGDPAEVDPHVLREISRLGLRHERITEIFRTMRQRIGVPDPPPSNSEDQDRP